jgi:hypothetical protein
MKMMVALAAPMLLAAPVDRGSRPASAVGRELSESISRMSAHVRESLTFGEPWRTTIADLCDLSVECSQPNWDGYGAPPLNPEVFRAAQAFVASIPLDIPTPAISASADGDVTFEWAQTARRLVSVAISENGQISFASLNGHKRSFGSMPFDGTFDGQLRSLIEAALG